MRRPYPIANAVHLILAVAVVALPLAAAQPWPICGTGGNYTAGSTYESNLLKLATTLRANASASPTLFATGVRGTAPDAVYGLLLCRGDVSASDCADCGTRVFQDVGQVCNRTRDASLVYNQCYAQFSDRGDFLAATNNSGDVSLLISGTNISSNDVAGYDRAVTELLNATVRYAVENSTRLFATGQRVGNDPGFRNIYSMAQCSPDLSPALCRRCLDGLVGQWWETFPLNGEGARVAGARCYLRSELGTGPFYTGAPMVLLRADGLSPASAPAPDLVPATTGGSNNSATKILVIVLPIVAVAIVAAISLCLWNMRKNIRSTKAEHFSGLDSSEDLESVKSTLLTLASLQVATDNFDESKKLGEGGFGAVYKGLLYGQEVAVKRMSKGSNQGLEELKNELVLVAKLHHKNLVRLVGFCLEDGERLLVYEYMPNKKQVRQLDWATRFRIIEGVARGLQYLHQDSQKKIVHRDMKASNVLLDVDMNPKIGDFGLARLFGQDQTRDVTNRIVGTFGYMAPEYVIRGQYSTKSDVFSFGILVLEIVTGQRNSGPCFSEQNEDLVWRHWTEGNIVEMIDYSLRRNYPEAEVLKCVNIGLLCVQQNPVERPTMADVVVLLNTDATCSLPAPAAHRPTFFLDGSSGYSQTITQLSPRPKQAELAPLPWPVCGSSANSYTVGSTYETNLGNLAFDLRTNASSSTLFASGTVGSTPDTVYGLLLCRGDVSTSDCADCGSRVIQDIGQFCNRTKDKILVYNQCYAQFSDNDFLAATNNSGGYSLLISGTNISSGADVVAYDRAVIDLLNATVRHAVGNPNRRLFATGKRVGTDPAFGAIYSLAQCSPDLSPAQCQRCHDDLLAQWWETFPVNGRGARVAGPRCYLESELGPFYTGDPMVLLLADELTPVPAPAPPDGVPATTGGKNNSARKILVIILPIVAVAIVAAVSLCIWNMCRKNRSVKSEHFSGHDRDEDFESVKSTLLSLASLQVATDNFHESKKLGEGGFGSVYKIVVSTQIVRGLLSGQEVAVKRMSKGSNEGLEELKNELVLVAKIHHRNVVCLVGFCLEKGEKLLVYEYIPNKSLDTILFDREQRRWLDWATRFRVIEGLLFGQEVAVKRMSKGSNQGLEELKNELVLVAKLHHKNLVRLVGFCLEDGERLLVYEARKTARLGNTDSQKKIVHRDMKASNVLLDVDMNPKIGDFGLARLFGQDQTRDVTNRIVGTFGYMARYVIRGQYSTKSDVFGFGIVVLEIVTGQRNSGPYFSEQNEDLVWRHWTEGNIVEVLKCVNIGLLCVQQNPVERPTMADVMVLLNSDATSSLPAPAAHRPTVFLDGSSGYSQSITQLSPR
uniref:Uncharacterized protein n=1 Tax=Leersia perrieri TaxID=77586 RepID=A0A0D9WZY0_9ORYZ